jgi:hypothetical protein
MPKQPGELKVETYRFIDDGTVPNNPLPLVVYRGALAESGDRASACERMFDRNGWPGAWRNGIYGHHLITARRMRYWASPPAPRGCGSAATTAKPSNCAPATSS